ncbi:hypothetical protein CLOM_g15239 [Closterium sp. NIES-68]|nr:hypothetical protein CLOM_g15239 [Closterium sp. NIES-68]
MVRGDRRLYRRRGSRRRVACSFTFRRSCRRQPFVVGPVQEHQQPRYQRQNHQQQQQQRESPSKARPSTRTSRIFRRLQRRG